jgi:dsDNA-binding SOS-regulon protein
MAIITKYVVEHKGVEKLVTTDKKEADKYERCSILLIA